MYQERCGVGESVFDVIRRVELREELPPHTLGVRVFAGDYPQYETVGTVTVRRGETYEIVRPCHSEELPHTMMIRADDMDGAASELSDILAQQL
jgi:hypothetical protein